jgi:hypothetical protein
MANRILQTIDGSCGCNHIVVWLKLPNAISAICYPVIIHVCYNGFWKFIKYLFIFHVYMVKISIKTYISNAVHTTLFWNNLHQVRSKSKRLERITQDNIYPFYPIKSDNKSDSSIVTGFPTVVYNITRTNRNMRIGNQIYNGFWYKLQFRFLSGHVFWIELILNGKPHITNYWW